MIELTTKAVYNPSLVSGSDLWNILVAQKELEENLSKVHLGLEKKVELFEVDIEYIIRVVCDYFDITVHIFHSKIRKREVVQARQVAMYFAKTLTKLPLKTIGKKIGNKDHATVLHACRSVENMYKAKQYWDTGREEIVDYRKKIDDIRWLLGG